MDPNTTLIHVSSGDEFDHVSKKDPHKVVGWIEGATTGALDDFHVLDVNINFALVQEMHVKIGQTVNASSSLVQQILAIHDLHYVLGEHHGDYVSKNNVGIKQNHMP